jgi:DNA-binding beta-propeller fold protein YncE
MLWLALALAACGAPAPAAAPTPAPAPPLANDALSHITQVGKPAIYETPFDAAPSPDGKTIYFTAEGAGGAGVFVVPADGGAAVALSQGSPFAAPRGLEISGDGATIYVADPTANQVFALPAAGGAPIPVPGSAGTKPRAVAITSVGGSDTLLIAGSSPTDGKPALLRLPLGGGKIAVVSSGAPMTEPSGIAVSPDGTVYLADRSAGGDGRGSLFRLRGGAVETLASGFRTGGPVVGVALLRDGSAALVSSLAEDDMSAQALIVNLKTMAQARFNKVIGGTFGAGGLHRAAGSDRLAWADSTGPTKRKPGTGGGVYLLEP